MKKLTVVAVVAVAVVSAVTFLLLKDGSSASSELFKEAYAKALSTETGNVYAEFELDSDRLDFNGEIYGDMSGRQGADMRGTMQMNLGTPAVPIDVTLQMLAKTDGDKTLTFSRITDASSNDSTTDEALKQQFGPLLNIWSRTEEVVDAEVELANFETDGPLAAINIAGLFTPFVEITQQDKDIYLAAVERYNLYTVDDEIEETTFKGVSARKVRVGVNKQKLIDFEDEVSKTLSDEASYNKESQEFIDQIFAGQDMYYADVFFNINEAEIIGVDLSVKLSDPIIDEISGLEFENVKLKLLIDETKTLEFDLPEEYLDTEEYNKLLSP